nr:hypothetical protein [Streptomyces sp. F001]
MIGTPISENAFAGLGGGLALDGRFRPIVEYDSCTPTSCGWRQTSCSTRSERPATCSEVRQGAVRPAQQGGHGYRLRITTLDGPGRHPRDRTRLAHSRTVDRSTTSA